MTTTSGGGSQQMSEPRRIALLWPGYGGDFELRQDEDGRWNAEERSSDVVRRGLQAWRDLYRDGAGDLSVTVLEGDKVETLDFLARTNARTFRLAYLDMPRINVDDKTSAFSGIRDQTYSTWLSVLKTTLERLKPLLSRQGVVVIHVGDDEEALARLVADDVLGRPNRVGSIVWQKRYAPLNMKGMKELTAAHDTLHVYAFDKASLPPVGLKEFRDDYANPDGDPRGPWLADHKGSATRRDSTDFDTFVPPYRWELLEGELPPGVWRLSPMSGVLWGESLEAVGEWKFTVRVTDADGAFADSELAIVVTEGAPQPPLVEVPWAFEEHKASGKLRVTTDSLPTGRLGAEYSAIVVADGGRPYHSEPKRPTPPRWWEISKSTLAQHYARDNVHFGAKGDSIPKEKKHDPDAVTIVNQTTWWPGRDSKETKTPFAGYTQDATRALQSLVEDGHITLAPRTAKPEALMARMLSLFTDSGDLVLEVFGDAGDLAATALKMERSAIVLRSVDPRSRQMTEECVLPRLRHVASTDVVEAQNGLDPCPGCTVRFAEVGPWFAKRRVNEEIIELNEELDDDALKEAVLSAMGFVPATEKTLPMLTGLSLDGATRAVYLHPDEYLTPEALAEAVTSLTDEGHRLVILYFAASEDLDLSGLPSSVRCRRVPYEIGI